MIFEPSTQLGPIWSLGVLVQGIVSKNHWIKNCHQNGFGPKLLFACRSMNFRLKNKNSTSVLLDIIWYLPDFWNFSNFEISSGWSYPTFDNLSRINTSNLYALEILDFHIIKGRFLSYLEVFILFIFLDFLLGLTYTVKVIWYESLLNPFAARCVEIKLKFIAVEQDTVAIH